MIVEWEFRWRGDKRSLLLPIGFCLRGGKITPWRGAGARISIHCSWRVGNVYFSPRSSSLDESC